MDPVVKRVYTEEGSLRLRLNLTLTPELTRTSLLRTEESTNYRNPLLTLCFTLLRS